MNEITWTRRYYWSLRRELWEHPSLWIAPLVAAAVALIAALISSVRLPMAPVPSLLDPQELDLMSGVIMFAAYAAAAFYALDTLFGERRDRSILFWKSLPVSDVTTVLAKFSVPLLVVPVITAVITVVAFTLFAPLTRVHAPIIRTSAATARSR